MKGTIIAVAPGQWKVRWDETREESWLPAGVFEGRQVRVGDSVTVKGRVALHIPGADVVTVNRGCYALPIVTTGFAEGEVEPHHED